MGGLTVSPNSYKHFLSVVKCFLWFGFNVGGRTILEIIKVTHLSHAKGTASKPAATLPHSQCGGGGGQTGQGAPGCLLITQPSWSTRAGVQMGRWAVEILEGSRAGKQCSLCWLHFQASFLLFLSLVLLFHQGTL